MISPNHLAKAHVYQVPVQVSFFYWVACAKYRKNQSELSENNGEYTQICMVQRSNPPPRVVVGWQGGCGEGWGGGWVGMLSLGYIIYVCYMYIYIYEILNSIYGIMYI